MDGTVFGGVGEGGTCMTWSRVEVASVKRKDKAEREENVSGWTDGGGIEEAWKRLEHA